MQKIFPAVRFEFPARSVPLALILTCIAAFGTLIPALGFYQDDWHPVYYGYARGLSSIWELFAYDSRPFAAVIYWIAFPIIGYKPLHWHLLALSLRTLTVLFTWLTLRDVWPDHKREITWAALLFAVYPLFQLQPLSLIYTIHWTGFLLFSISIWAMVRSLRDPRRFWAFALLALVANGLHLILLEYFAGVELARPLILYLLLRDKEETFGRRIGAVFKYWWPYLLVLLAFGVYRVFFLPGPEKGSVGNQPTLIFEFFQSPLQTTIDLVQMALQDTIAILYSVWHAVIDPEVFAFTTPANLKTLAVVLLAAAVLFIYLSNLRFETADILKTKGKWARAALFLGLVMTILGPLPAWIIGQSITTDNPLWSGRFGLASMAGASLVVVALLEALVANMRARLAILSLLVGFSIGWHVFNTNEFRHSWFKQTDFYWQLRWRAPYIQPGTALLSSGEIFPRMGEYPTAFALSTLYPKTQDSSALNYYFFSLSRHFDTEREDLIRGMRLRKVAYSSVFSGDSRNSLLIFYEPENYECLWVLRPQDAQIRVLPEITREVAVISNVDRIQPESPRAQPPPLEIFGREPAHNWCYYYQKADLARQQGDWQGVVSLWEEAAAKGLSPGNGVEYLPFIEGFARTGGWETAGQMTFTADESARVMAPILCATWQQIEQDTPSSDGRNRVLGQIYAQLCPATG